MFEVLDTPSETDEGRATLVRIIKNAHSHNVRGKSIYNCGKFKYM